MRVKPDSGVLRQIHTQRGIKYGASVSSRRRVIGICRARSWVG